MRRDCWYHTAIQVLASYKNILHVLLVCCCGIRGQLLPGFYGILYLSELLFGICCSPTSIIGESNGSDSLTQHPEDNGVYSYDVLVRTLGGTADTSSTPAVVPAAQASDDSNRGDRTFTETQQFCTNSSIVMKHTATVTPQVKKVSARYGQNLAIQKECTPTGGHNTPREATVTETERQHAQTPDITPEEAIVTETERFCALVQVMLHYYAHNLVKEKK